MVVSGVVEVVAIVVDSVVGGGFGRKGRLGLDLPSPPRGLDGLNVCFSSSLKSLLSRESSMFSMLIVEKISATRVDSVEVDVVDSL